MKRLDSTDLLKNPQSCTGQIAPVQTDHLPDLLNLWNPRRFCFLAEGGLRPVSNMQQDRGFLVWKLSLKTIQV
jgi:hypothetical protein